MSSLVSQSVDLQRVLEGEKAQRSDAVRRLKDTEKQLALVRSPAHAPLVLSSPLARTAPASEDDLEHRRSELLERVARHSQQIVELQQQLVRVRADEEARGGGAADARRWNQLRNVVEARTMLKTVFRSASAHKALAAEAATEATEMREECELLRLKLEIAQQERDAARKVAAAAATAAVAIAGGGGAGSPGEAGRPVVSRLTTSVDAEVSSLLEAMEMAAPPNGGKKGVVRPLLRTPSGDVLVGSGRSIEVCFILIWVITLIRVQCLQNHTATGVERARGTCGARHPGAGCAVGAGADGSGARRGVCARRGGGGRRRGAGARRQGAALACRHPRPAGGGAGGVRHLQQRGERRARRVGP